ncbi:polyphosphate polymerase domain-containing protein [Planococcus beigongshangi]|uniref:polyphosphate polymerase domain-containing protein n=1 Tax=Planococcus beigongshangi TaxID=2782536 RepID=UPI002104F141|nr:polyphosphate polymerase domain-containing protein [Planococcus beigongshangi]
MAIEIFSRKEQKYLITRKQYTELVRELAPYMRNDRNGEQGRYTVSSLYFDTPDKTIYFETKNKVKYRQKLRLRVYGEVESGMKSFFEIKQKHDKVVHKRRLTMPLDEANRYLTAGAGGPLSGYRVSICRCCVKSIISSVSMICIRRWSSVTIAMHCMVIMMPACG